MKKYKVLEKLNQKIQWKLFNWKIDLKTDWIGSVIEWIWQKLEP